MPRELSGMFRVGLRIIRFCPKDSQSPTLPLLGHIPSFSAHLTNPNTHPQVAKIVWNAASFGGRLNCKGKHAVQVIYPLSRPHVGALFDSLAVGRTRITRYGFLDLEIPGMPNPVKPGRVPKLCCRCVTWAGGKTPRVAGLLL